MVLLRVGRYLAQLGHNAREAVNVGHGEVDASFLGDGQQVQDGVGGATHGDVQRDAVLEGLEAHGARQHRFVILLVVLTGQFHDAVTGALEQLFAVGVGCHHRAVAGQDRPSASVRQFMELAVNMPEQEPQVGQAERSTWATCSSV